MDQDAFRNLLSVPRGDAGPSRSHQKGNFGAAPPKRGWGLKQTKEHKAQYGGDREKEKKVEHIAPRHAQKKSTEGIYKDRAELRRAGKDDEYKDVEQMLADFEKRKAEAEDAETVEKTRQFLGGDATHSVLVKGLDYSLLAQRRAELEREQEVGRDEELEAMMDDIPTKPGPSVPTDKKESEAEKLGKGFKTIGNQADGDKKKKKKKKSEVVAQIKVEEDIKPKDPEPIVSAKPVASTSKIMAKSILPPPPDDDEDIFGDAGEYDLGGGALSSDDSDEESELGQVEKQSPRSRSRSGEKENRYRGRSYSRPRTRSRSRERGEVRERDHSRVDRRDPSRERYDRRDRSRSREDYRRHTYRDNRQAYSRSRSRSRDALRQRYRSPSRTPPRQYESRRRSRTPPGRYRSRSRSQPRYNDKRRRVDSPSRSPPRRRRSPSLYRRDRYRSPSPNRRNRSPTPPPAKPTRRPTRSPSPFNFAAGPPMSRSPSLSRSPSPVFGGKLQPLQSSAITDLSGFLAAESAGAKADEKKMKKAQWRSRQGLGVQEGVDPSSLKREMNDKQKSNREYILLMNKLKKDEEAGAGGGGKGKAAE